MHKRSKAKQFGLSLVALSVASASLAQYAPPIQVGGSGLQTYGPGVQTYPVQPGVQVVAPQVVAPNPTAFAVQQPVFQQPYQQGQVVQPAQPIVYGTPQGYAAPPAAYNQGYDSSFTAQQQPMVGGGGSGLREVVQKALATNPDVRARWNAFMSSTEDVSVARGGLFPNLNYSGQIDRNWAKTTTVSDSNIADTTPPTTSTSNSSVDWGRKWHKTPYALTLSQSIFEGFATVNLISQYGKERLAKYLDFLSTSEDIAQAAGEAYYDVIRRRRLLGLAEDYFVLHRAIFEQINQRTAQGIANRVDLDQAASRLALSDYSLTVEQANLHDVSTRYQRIVGELPSPGLFDAYGIANSLPGSSMAAVQMAFANSPTLRAAIERVAAAGYQLSGARSAFYPKLSFQGKIQADRDNYPSYSTSGTTTSASQVTSNNARNVGLYASWNLFNGFADMARVRKFEYERDATMDQRERACRDLRQNVAISYNSAIKWREGLNVTRSQVATLEKARDAYRDQYNIGKRSLLDLLNTEKELFDARSTLVNSEADLNINALKLLANMGALLQQLGMMRTPGQDGVPDSREFEQGLAEICPPQTAYIEGTNRAELENRARALIAQRTTAPAPVFNPAPLQAAPLQTVSLAADALFSLGSATLQAKGISEINNFADKLRGQNFNAITVVGHTDRLGSASSNMSLSQRRAEAVKAQLVSRGINASQISTSGRGQNEPVTGGKCDRLGARSSRNRALVDCLQPDRRVEIQVR